MRSIDEAIAVPQANQPGAATICKGYDERWVFVPSAGAFVGTVTFEGRFGSLAYVPFLVQTNSPTTAYVYAVPQPFDDVRVTVSGYASGAMAAVLRGSSN